MECTSHKGEKVFMVCKSCDKYPFVCGICLEEEHAEHKVQTLRNAAQSLRQNLEQVDTDNEQVFKDIRSDLDGITKFREDQQIEADCVEDGIANHIDVIKCEVDSVKQDVMEKYKGESVKNKEAIDRTEEALKKQVSQIDTFKMKVAQLQKMNDYVDVIKTARDVEIPDTNRLPRPEIQPLEFVPGSVRIGELAKMFGDINTADSSNNKATTTRCDEGATGNDDKTNISSDFVGSVEVQSYIIVTPVTSFKLFKHSDGVDTMFCSEAGLCWLKCQDKNSVKLSNISGQIKQAINLGTQTKGFTVTSDNRLLFCCSSQQCIKEMSLPHGDIKLMFSTSPLTPNYICTGPSGDIYVTMFDEDDYFVDEDSIRVLVQYDSTGEEIGRCQTDEDDEPIFVLPQEVCVNNTETRIAVINEINNNRRELVILDKNLSPITLYRGPSKLTGKLQTGLCINGAVFDSRDNIVIVEGITRTIQLMSPSCEPLKVLFAMEAIPWCLSKKGEKVWVGDEKGILHVFRYSD